MCCTACEHTCAGLRCEALARWCTIDWGYHRLLAALFWHEMHSSAGATNEAEHVAHGVATSNRLDLWQVSSSTALLAGQQHSMRVGPLLQKRGQRLLLLLPAADGDADVGVGVGCHEVGQPCRLLLLTFKLLSPQD